jgi:hypothetical protein
VIHFNVDLTSWDDFLQRLHPDRVASAVKAMTTGLARLLLRYSQMNAPVRTGNLRRSGFMIVDDDGLAAIVGYATGYAGVIEAGSKPHDIAAVNALSLAFIPSSFPSLADAVAASKQKRRTGTAKPNSDYIIFPRHVFHPGTVAEPFLATGWEDSKPDAQQFLVEVGSHFVKGEEQDE